MNRKFTISGIYNERGCRYASPNWEQVCADHELEFPMINECHPGTFNVTLSQNSLYTPPNESMYRALARARGLTVGRYEDGNHVAPCSRVIQINSIPLVAWIYRGGHRDHPILELLAHQQLALMLGVSNGDKVELIIEEVPEGTEEMPGIPPKIPGRTIS